MLAVFLFATLMNTGCTTTSSGTSVLDASKVAQLAPALQATVAGAVVYAYTKDTNAVSYIALIQTALNEFILSDDLSASKLQAKLYGLPVKELKTPEAQLIITPIIAAYKAFGEQYVKAGLAGQDGWKALVKALVDGVTDGMAGITQIKASS